MINLDDSKNFERMAAALEDISRGLKKPEPAGAEPAGVPILLIVEVLIALIGILVRHVVADPVPAVKLRELKKKLMPYQPVRPAGKEVNDGE